MSWSIGSALLKALTPRFVARAPTAAPPPQAIANPEPLSLTQYPLDPVSPDARDSLRLRPEVEKLLLDAGMPPEGSSLYDGPRRAVDTPEDAARKFIMWAQAVGATGEHTVRTISALYWECAEVDHREPVAIERFLRALKAVPGLRQDAATGDRRRRVWIIDPPPPPRQPKAQVAIAAKIVAQTPHLHARVLQRLAPDQDHSSPELLRAMAHDARRQGRARKQRGSRNVRWAT